MDIFKKLGVPTNETWEGIESKDKFIAMDKSQAPKESWLLHYL